MNVPSDLLPMLRELVPQPVEVVGGGVEGQSTIRFLLDAGYERITLRDKNPQVVVPDGVSSRTGDSYLEGMDPKGTLVRSAGIRPDSAAFEKFRAEGGRVLSQLHIYLALAQGVKGQRVAGITGTFGKGTITTLISRMLDKAGIRHAVGGNIGTAMLDLLATPDIPGVALLELSSFQLFDLGAPPGFTALDRLAFVPRVGVANRVTIEHLDWHKDQVEYWEAKARLCEEQGENDHAIFLSQDPGSVFVGMAGSGIEHPIGPRGQFQPESDKVLDEDGNVVLRREDMRVPGAFQLSNAAVAWAAAKALGADDVSCRSAAQEFEGLPHRLQFCGEHAGVRYYNDSYATRPEATLAAVEALSGSDLALILGGSDKGIDFSELAAGLRSWTHLRHVCLIGATAGRLREALQTAGPTPFPLVDHPHLPEAFADARAAVAKGGAVLLSPACASFGLFKNYKQRGEAFLGLVRELSLPS
ncbi:MAG TPA: UDP-N-acetylmuramoyl-L-alanine--D-glutamate ligase [Fibrobacteria bacterium]|nr:UDP-N-acetylmuramoyl-L-alanine--D-glutamate ligase [Fibrobacteria bacterium]HOX52233.1 UDP-N-acetylmuramoyl-L-alanine--D-glutamate ligase [Fibrobacteria bacterium]